MNNRKLAVTFLYQKDGKVLGVSRKDNHTDFGIPGGKVDPGETPEQAIVREVKEETGLDISGLHRIWVRYDGFDYISITFTADNISGELFSSEKGKCEWITWDQLKAGSFGHYNIGLHEFITAPKAWKIKLGEYYLDPNTMEPMYINAVFVTNREYAVVSGCTFPHPLCISTRALINKTLVISYDMYSKYTEEMKALPAKMFALRAHNDAAHFYDGRLYGSAHLAAVVSVAHRFMHLLSEELRERVEDALWNHDAIEDVRVTYGDVSDVLGTKVADIAFALTNNRGKKRSERADYSYYELIRLTPGAVFAKLCDRIANLEQSVRSGHTMLDKYRKELPSFESKLRNEEHDEYVEMWDHIYELLEPKLIENVNG